MASKVACEWKFQKFINILDQDFQQKGLHQHPSSSYLEMPRRKKEEEDRIQTNMMDGKLLFSTQSAHIQTIEILSKCIQDSNITGLEEWEHSHLTNIDHLQLLKIIKFKIKTYDTHLIYTNRLPVKFDHVQDLDCLHGKRQQKELFLTYYQSYSWLSTNKIDSSRWKRNQAIAGNNCIVLFPFFSFSSCFLDKWYLHNQHLLHYGTPQSHILDGG